MCAFDFDRGKSVFAVAGCADFIEKTGITGKDRLFLSKYSRMMEIRRRRR
jgi:hypothetical protein